MICLNSLYYSEYANKINALLSNYLKKTNEKITWVLSAHPINKNRNK